jgi:hypothetical protein
MIGTVTSASIYVDIRDEVEVEVEVEVAELEPFNVRHKLRDRIVWAAPFAATRLDLRTRVLLLRWRRRLSRTEPWRWRGRR